MSTTGRVYKASRGDALWQQILEIDKRYFPEPWDLANWEGINGDFDHLVAWCENEAVDGFALFRIIPGDETAHLLKVCLRPYLRGTGVAIKFWDEIIYDLQMKGVEKVFLEVAENNQVAINFYKKLNFKLIRVIKGFYSSGESALTMLLTLGD